MRETAAVRRLMISALLACASSPASAQTLEAISTLPADTFAPGPTSGQLITPANGRIPPFVNKQPVQGASSVLPGSDGTYWVMADNGFGAKPNSPDYLLRMFRIKPDFKTKRGGSGVTSLRSFITLSDPYRKIPFPIVADETVYPGSAIPVDADLKRHRWLTGGDFDIESVREAHDGTLWFGDEFGPFLIHTNQSGEVLEAPYPLPGVMSPQNPNLGTATPNLPRSRGFEGMAVSPNGRTLYPMLEGSLTTDPDQRRLFIYEFDVKARRYTGQRWSYRLEVPITTGQAIGDLTMVDRHRFLVIERDNFEGPLAAFKKIFLVDLRRVDADGYLIKREVANLLDIRDPLNLAGFGPVFRFPFQTIESVIVLSKNRLGVLNDNNYPFSAGRVAGQPDPNEFIIIKLDRALPSSDTDDDETKDDDDE